MAGMLNQFCVVNIQFKFFSVLAMGHCLICHTHRSIDRSFAPLSDGRIKFSCPLHAPALRLRRSKQLWLRAAQRQCGVPCVHLHHQYAAANNVSAASDAVQACWWQEPSLAKSASSPILSSVHKHTFTFTHTWDLIMLNSKVKFMLLTITNVVLNIFYKSVWPAFTTQPTINAIFYSLTLPTATILNVYYYSTNLNYF